ncbi:TPA: DUF2946 domain-containing protein [Stenotrophomonas maltophilia]|nr:DUF2946 domain-containing protein [Stenotrophomonas maltophilia]HDS0951689.1 DUF2946 domain-containing protein [Stenotrophomonas maltophilia]HDS1026028.1 DUF2946 domain-containing protein [Stenotrophomonas maltophilia]HDS1028233.1 DUF2946 domain-containing protein [Stenotrophomonas maltophilia]HDS1028623.1 DUF2946 domain-containing protein [Stenotrophomonas maltophilia]
MLLVLLAPLVSRWLAHGPAPMPAATAVAIPGQAEPAPHADPAAHMQHAGHAAHAQHAMEAHHDHHAMAMQHGGGEAKPSADPHADHEMGVDCDYCLIAARLITLLVAAFLLLVPLAPVCRAVCGSVAALPARIAGSLGARGPPAALAG